MARQYLTIEELQKEFPNIKQNAQSTNDDYLTAIQNASSEVETLIGRWIEKQIAAGTYALANGELSIVANKEQDNVDGKQKLAAIKEGIGILAKFSIDTGYDFITGSQAMNMGAESFSETTDFETSYFRVKTRVKELLANYEFDNLLMESGNPLVQEANADPVDEPWVPSEDRTLTEKGLLARLTDLNYIEGVNGIAWVMKDNTNPMKGVYIRLDENKLNEYIAKNVSSLRSFKGEYTVVNKNDISTNYNDILNGQVQNPQVGDIALLKLVLPAEPIYNGLIETYAYLSGRWEKTTANFEIAKSLDNIEKLAEELDIKLLVQDAKIAAIVAKDNTQDDAISSIRASLDVINRTITDQGVRIVSAETKIGTLETKATGLETRMAAVEQAQSLTAIYKSAVRKWIGTKAGSATQATANTSTFDLSQIVATDNDKFDFTSGKEIKIWVKGTAGTAFNVPIDIIVGATEPTLIEAVRSATGTNLETLYATLSTAGILTITRNAGTFIDFTSLNAFEMKEDILALATQFASKQDVADLQAEITTINGNISAFNTQLTALKTQIGTDTLTTTAQTIIAAINEIRAAYIAADTALHTTITTEQSSKIKYYAGQIAIFNTEKVAPSKFADTTLFDKEIIGGALKGLDANYNYWYRPTATGSELVRQRKGYKLIGTYNKGQTNPNLWPATGTDAQPRDGYIKLKSDGVVEATALSAQTWPIKDGMSSIYWVIYTGAFQFKTTETGIAIIDKRDNLSWELELYLAYPIEVVANKQYKYIAKKDITFAEMGE